MGSSVPRETHPGPIYLFVDICLNTYSVCRPRHAATTHHVDQTPAPHANASTRQRRNGNQDLASSPPTNAQLIKLTCKPRDDSRVVAPSQDAPSQKYGETLPGRAPHACQRPMHLTAPSRLKIHASATNHTASPRHHAAAQAPDTQLGITAHTEHSTDGGATRLVTPTHRALTPRRCHTGDRRQRSPRPHGADQGHMAPNVTSRESHRRSPSSYGRSPALRRQPGRALQDLR